MTTQPEVTLAAEWHHAIGPAPVKWTSPLLAVCVLVAMSGCGDGAATGPAQGADGTGGADTTSASDTGEVPDAGEGDECPYALDGVCDEPMNCELGTDRTDCQAACQAGDDDPGLWGACRYLTSGLPDHDLVSDDEAARGSWGTGGRRGRWYGVIDATGSTGEGTIQRYYSVFVPRSYRPERPSPVVYYGGGFGDEMFHTPRYTDLEALAERHRILVVYIQQDFRDFGLFNYQMAWYVYLNAFTGGWSNCPDLPFYAGVLEELKAAYNVDRTRVYLTGTSRGGGISIMMAFLRPDLFTGFISQAGFIAVNDFGAYIESYTGRQMAAVLIAGNQDTNVDPWESLRAARLLEDLGWGDRLMYLPIEGAGHQWQTHLSQRWWDFVSSHPIPLDEVAP